jgi:peptidoglycan hydrolase-like protein with peptidoglycan-binding domain
VPYVDRSLRVLALAIASVLIPLVAASGADARTKYKPKLTSSSTGGAGIDPYHHMGARALRYGLKGHDVKIAQDFLRKAGFHVALDGVYGSGTVAVVKRFERANGVKPNGRLSLREIDLLRGFVSRGAMYSRTRNVKAFPATADAAGLNADGTAIPPTNAPPQVAQIIEAGNLIAHHPYIYGGGHGKWNDRGYDCSGSVSFALHGAGFLDQALTSGDFARWGDAGTGDWVTLYANGGHVYMTVAGLRFDTSGASSTGSRWQSDMRSPRGYTIRHPEGL